MFTDLLYLLDRELVGRVAHHHGEPRSESLYAMEGEIVKEVSARDPDCVNLVCECWGVRTGHRKW